MNFIFITLDCYPFPIAKHVYDEGHSYAIAQLDSVKQLDIKGMEDDEEPEDKKERLSCYDGILKKHSLSQVMNFLSKVKDSEKKDYFFFFDFNNLYKISQEIIKMGFTNGLFPTETNYRLEKERELAKKFVNKYYPRVKVAESFTFKSIDDGIKKVNEGSDVYVLKSNGNLAGTVVPKSNDIKIGKEQVVDALKKFKKEYEEGGFTLEKKILNALEVTPIMVFYNSKPLYSIVEFENKNYGSGNIGAQKGGNQACSIMTDLDSEINKIAFPEIVYKMSKQQKGMYVWDCGLLYDGRYFWFTEFCSQRFGWDGIFSNMCMTGDDREFVGDYFTKIVKGENPLREKYGTSIRLFNYEGDTEDSTDPQGGEVISFDPSIKNNLFLYNVRKENDKLIDTSDRDFIGCITASGKTFEESVKKLYKRVDKFNFEKLYYRPKFDFLSKDYKSSIPNRIYEMEGYI